MLHEVSSSEKGKLAIHFTSLLKFELTEFQKSLWKCKNMILKTRNTETSTPEREGDDRGWDGWHHQLNGHESEQAPGVDDGQGSLVWCSLWGRRVVHNWATELNWIQTHKTSTPSLWMIISHVTNLLTLDTLNPSTRYMNISFWNGLKTEGCSWWIFSSEISVWEAEVLLWVVLSGVLKMSIISGLNSLN